MLHSVYGKYLRVLVTALALSLATATALRAQDRCERYAHRAVEQYKLMRSHPGCQVKADLRWQDSYDNHLFACRHTPELLTKAEDAARDQHLRTCGGLTPEPVPASPVGSAAPAPATPPGAAAAANTCQVALPPSFALAYGTIGTDGEIADGVLRYRDSKKHDARTFQVIRPTYYAEQQKCGAVPAGTLGPWVSRGASGQTDMYFLLSAGKTVQAWPLRHALFEQLVAPPNP